MIVRETLSLVPGVSLASSTEGGRVLNGRVQLTLPPLSGSVSATIEALAQGEHGPDELSELAGGGGLAQVAFFHNLLEALRAHGVLARSLSLDGALIARLSPETARGGGVSPRAEMRYQLSRFAFSRVAEGGSQLETPLSMSRVWMGTWHGPALLGVLATPKLPAEVAEAVPGVPPEVTAAFLGMLLEAGALVEVNAEGVPVEREALITWEFHDLLFYQWTRWPRHAKGYGGATYRFRGKLPQPEPKPRPPGEALPLEKPDMARLERGDSSFTSVLERRRTVRNPGGKPLTRAQLGELLYRAVGLRHADLDGRDQKVARVYPSGGAIYETGVYTIVRSCEGLEPGLYAYQVDEHALYRIPARTPELAELMQMAADGMALPAQPQVVIVLTAQFARMAWKYEVMAYSAMLKNVGVIFQTLYLVATAMGLAPCALGSGGADLFARASGLDPLVEGSVGEFAVGSRPDGGPG
ncbi:SagB family peptide dehydrogenase [Hyalangium minutum]|uniref:TOMM biosynthesis dehydrogenase (Protein B) n=1 Tax=Hyalangium minutum TaxID=394096 RepID=A0A085WV71_9BACT|nr:SagB family peptide dehydrogenase [Hyalangium minutum]KFE71584.1 TOMM biosynthesis dehydrogenase (protein B) [Hyalangium minutum]